MPNIPDESLIVLSQQGDNEAVETLILRYLPFLKKMAAGFPGLDQDDLTQEGMIALIFAIRRYDVSRGASFKTYAAACIHNRMCNAVRAALREKNKSCFEEQTSGSAARTEAPCSALDPQSIFFSREQLEELRTKIRSLLSARETEVLRLYLRGHSYDEIARILTCNGKSVDNALQRIRKKLKALKV